MIGTLGFCIGGALGFASGFVLGVDYGRRHSEPWRDLGETVGDFATWAKSTLKPAPAPVNEPPASAGSFTATGGGNTPQA